MHSTEPAHHVAHSRTSTTLVSLPCFTYVTLALRREVVSFWKINIRLHALKGVYGRRDSLAKPRKKAENFQWAQSAIFTLRHVPTNGPEATLPCMLCFSEHELNWRDGLVVQPSTPVRGLTQRQAREPFLCAYQESPTQDDPTCGAFGFCLTNDVLICEPSPHPSVSCSPSLNFSEEYPEFFW